MPASPVRAGDWAGGRACGRRIRRGACRRKHACTQTLPSGRAPFDSALAPILLCCALQFAALPLPCAALLCPAAFAGARSCGIDGEYGPDINIDAVLSIRVHLLLIHSALH